MTKWRWIGFEHQVNNWIKKNNFAPLSAEKTLQVMKNSIYRTAPHVAHWTFVNIFGMPDEKYLTQDIVATCKEVRDKWTKMVTRPFRARLNPEIVIEAVKLTNEQMGLKRKFKTASLYEVYDASPKDTSSGAPDYHTPKRDTMHDALRYIQGICDGIFDLPAIKDFWPVTIAWRTQMRSSGEKHRIIAVFPQVISLMEMIFAKPFFDFYSDNVGRTFYSFGSCWVENSKLWHSLQAFRNVVSIDWEGFDISVIGELMLLFYNNLEVHLVFKGNLEHKMFKYVRDYHIYGTVINQVEGNPGVITNKIHGIMSGSVFTNFADTWINLFVINYCCIKLGYQIPDLMAAMGDDIVIGTNDDGELFLKLISKEAKETFDMTVSTEKSEVILPGQPMYYMGYYITNKLKYKDPSLIKRSLSFGGRFIKEEDLPLSMVEWSRFCSVCASASNGYEFWLEYKDAVLKELGISDPGYFHDLSEGPGKPFRLDRIVEGSEQYVRDAWMYV